MAVLRRLPVLLLCPVIMGLAQFSWEDGFLARLELLALIETLNADLLSHSSATLTLERWCADHGLAKTGKVVAELDRGAEKKLDDRDRERLALAAHDRLRYRHVRLFCGEKLLSEADNWYVENRLSQDMNRLLDETDTPFGRAVSGLNFRRETISAELLWRPLPEHWELSPAIPPSLGARFEAPSRILEHRAILRTDLNVPFSYVVETYTSDVIAFPLPK
jgi:hypothetical protein